MTLYRVIGRDTGIPSLNDSALAGAAFGAIVDLTLTAGVEAELIDAGVIEVVLPAVGPFVDDDADLVDAVAINVAGTKKRRVPIADKLAYDLREFYAGTSQPADMLGYIHDGLDKVAVSGGWLQIPDSEEAWVVSSTIVPPPNSRMMGPGGARFSERNGASHGSGHGQFPVLPNTIGEGWIRLQAGANCPILMNDYDGSLGKRGPARGNGAYVQWFTADGIVFDHNGQNQSGSLSAIHVRSAWGMNFPRCRLVSPRGRGFVISNSNDCNAEKASAVGIAENVANGTGDLASSTTILNASGTWAIGDVITGTGIAASTRVTNVVTTTLTISSAALITATGSSLTKSQFCADHLLVLEDSTTDSDWIGISMHAAGAAGLLIDSAYGCRVSGLVGYSIGGYNVWLRDTMTGSANYLGCRGHRLDLRTEQATKHNVRIDADCNDNLLDFVAFAPGMMGTAADADGGWANVYCDGSFNVLRGTGFKGATIATTPTLSAIVAYGPNADFNVGQMGGGHDITAGTPLYSYRGTDLTTKGRRTNTEPGHQKGQIDTSRARLMDDFLGDVLAANWNAPTPGTDPQSIAPVIFPAPGGVVRLTTGDDPGSTMALNGTQLDSALNWSASRDATLEASVRINPGVSSVAVFIGFTDQTGALEMPFTLAAGNALTSNATDAVGFLYDTGADTDDWWFVGVKADVDATKQDSGLAPSVGVYQRLKVVLGEAGQALFYVNGALVGSVMNAAVGITTPLTPVVAAFGRAASRTIDIDYLDVEQYR